MDKLKRNFDMILTATLLVTGWGGWFLLTKYFPDNYFVLYPTIPLVFYLIGLVFIRVLHKAEKNNPARLLNLYMLIRFAKVGVLLLIVGLYYIFVKDNMRTFSLVFMMYYLLYLVFETLYYSQIERIIKKKKENE